MCSIHVYFSQNLDNTLTIIYVCNASRIFQFSSCLEIMIYAGSKEEGTSFWDCVLWDGAAALSLRQSFPMNEWSWVIGSPALQMFMSGMEQMISGTCCPELQMVLGEVSDLKYRQFFPKDTPEWSRCSKIQAMLPYQWS